MGKAGGELNWVGLQGAAVTQALNFKVHDVGQSNNIHGIHLYRNLPSDNLKELKLNFESWHIGEWYSSLLRLYRSVHSRSEDCESHQRQRVQVLARPPRVPRPVRQIATLMYRHLNHRTLRYGASGAA